MKTSTSTYWLFYLKDPSILTPEQLRCTELDGGFLYAYTDKKKYAKEWERERNMQIFRKEKKALTSEDVREITELHQNGRIRTFHGETYDAEMGDRTFQIALSGWEYEFLQMQWLFCEMTVLPSLDRPSTIGIFRKEFRTMLEKIGYRHLYYDDLPFSEYYLKPDFLRLFIHYFRPLL